jgi:hypothetical protein
MEPTGQSKLFVFYGLLNNLQNISMEAGYGELMQ